MAEVCVPAAPGAAGPGPLPALQPQAGAQPVSGRQVRRGSDRLLSDSSGIAVRRACEPVRRTDERPRSAGSQPRLRRQSRSLLVRRRADRYIRGIRCLLHL